MPSVRQTLVSTPERFIESTPPEAVVSGLVTLTIPTPPETERLMVVGPS